MKKNYFIYASFFIVIIISYGFGDGDGLRYPTGAPAGYTGSPSDGKNCTHCHGGTAINVDNWITSDIPETGYVPGQTYNITVTSEGSGKKGFEVSPQSWSGDYLGTLIAGSGSKLVGNDKYITHTHTVNSNPAVWTFQWIAPSEGTGDVTFYGAFAITKSHTRLSLLTVSEDVFASVGEHEISHFNVYPNPVTDQFWIKYDLRQTSNVTLRLLGLDGRIMYQYQVGTETAGKHIFHVSDGGSLAPGVYLLSLQTDNIQITRKLLVN